MCVVRSIHRAYPRKRANILPWTGCWASICMDGLLGFDLHGRTVGVIGTGRIGVLVARIMAVGFGCRVP